MLALKEGFESGELGSRADDERYLREVAGLSEEKITRVFLMHDQYAGSAKYLGMCGCIDQAREKR